ncbi:MAG: hypothetical protein ACKOTB_17520 [Planctomycetia bacterium]
MTKKPTSNDDPNDEEAQNKSMDRVDADPPYPADFSAHVEQFRTLLAELIAKQLLADREHPGDTPGPSGD